MNKRSIALLVATCLTAAEASWAVGPIMTVSFAADGSDCATQVIPFAPFTFYAGVYANTNVPGITGAEFRIANVDPAWFSTVTPNPAANISLGSPIGLGAAIAFPICQSALPGQFVLLYSIQSLSLSAVSPRDLQIVQHSTPSNPNFLCPLVTVCDAPNFTKICCPTLPGCLNQTHPCWCEFAVQGRSWSHVKALYAH